MTKSNLVHLIDDALAVEVASSLAVDRPYGLPTRAVDVFPLYSSPAMLGRAFAAFRQHAQPSGPVVALSHLAIPLAVLAVVELMKGVQHYPGFHSFADRVYTPLESIPMSLQGCLLVDDVLNTGDVLMSFLENYGARFHGNFEGSYVLVLLDNDTVQGRTGLNYAQREGLQVFALTRSSIVYSSLSRVGPLAGLGARIFAGFQGKQTGKRTWND